MSDLPAALDKLIHLNDLSQSEAYQVMAEFISGEADPVLITSILVALRMKGETIPEITGCAMAMREKAIPVQVSGPVMDCCGTGGDGSHSFNISTAVALILAAAGVKVAKHGNRAISSQSGSADVLQALEIPTGLDAEGVRKSIEETNFAFMLAPLYHPAMKNVMPVRRALGTRTVFNILGPLTNPACSEYQLLGVFDPTLVEPMANVLQALGKKRAMVVHGGGLDEIALHTSTQVCELKDGEIISYTIDPGRLGFTECRLEDLRGGDAQANADIIRAIFDGQEQGARRNAVLINTGAALMIGGKATSLAEGVRLAAETIDSGAANAKLRELSTMESTS
ncbi:anthranilate phosphoribosyltransferase [Candidatus Wirthbacteria bacterium CG2_30_54_11]|uniref:Anthranilate phosphoribosyltransferase n=1 Tax=Candidatus Wirthbacteria bacterium CG2_30_54_11 TaxID=1817892 RepID=A0A1J5IKG9_9BACT|nr:MAG: anthranilate phosphoribosyltransferase [Candidatus Wirthbacteria bacterium CG2_30_54_11]